MHYRNLIIIVMLLLLTRSIKLTSTQNVSRMVTFPNKIFDGKFRFFLWVLNLFKVWLVWRKEKDSDCRALLSGKKSMTAERFEMIFVSISPPPPSKKSIDLHPSSLQILFYEIQVMRIVILSWCYFTSMTSDSVLHYILSKKCHIVNFVNKKGW